MMEKKKDNINPLVYRLMKVTLTISVATESVERAT